MASSITNQRYYDTDDDSSLNSEENDQERILSKEFGEATEVGKKQSPTNDGDNDEARMLLKKRKAPRPKLTMSKLKSELVPLQNTCAGLRSYRKRGDEVRYINTLMRTVKEWTEGMFPHAAWEDTIDTIQKMGDTRECKDYMKVMRNEMRRKVLTEEFGVERADEMLSVIVLPRQQLQGVEGGGGGRVDGSPTSVAQIPAAAAMENPYGRSNVGATSVAVPGVSGNSNPYNRNSNNNDAEQNRSHNKYKYDDEEEEHEVQFDDHVVDAKGNEMDVAPAATKDDAASQKANEKDEQLQKEKPLIVRRRTILDDDDEEDIDEKEGDDNNFNMGELPQQKSDNDQSNIDSDDENESLFAPVLTSRSSNSSPPKVEDDESGCSENEDILNDDATRPYVDDDATVAYIEYSSDNNDNDAIHQVHTNDGMVDVNVSDEEEKRAEDARTYHEEVHQNTSDKVDVSILECNAAEELIQVSDSRMETEQLVLDSTQGDEDIDDDERQVCSQRDEESDLPAQSKLVTHPEQLVFGPTQGDEDIDDEEREVCSHSDEQSGPLAKSQLVTDSEQLILDASEEISDQ